MAAKKKSAKKKSSAKTASANKKSRDDEAVSPKTPATVNEPRIHEEVKRPPWFIVVLASIPAIAAVMYFVSVLHKPVPPEERPTQEEVQQIFRPEEGAERYETRGVIEGAADDGSFLTIAHEDIPNYMPAMSMPFFAGEGIDLTAYETGERVAFTFSPVGRGRHAIVEIEVVEDAPEQEPPERPIPERPADAPIEPVVEAAAHGAHGAHAEPSGTERPELREHPGTMVTP